MSSAVVRNMNEEAMKIKKSFKTVQDITIRHALDKDAGKLAEDFIKLAKESKEFDNDSLAQYLAFGAIDTFNENKCNSFELGQVNFLVKNLKNIGCYKHVISEILYEQENLSDKSVARIFEFLKYLTGVCEKEFNRLTGAKDEN